LQPRALWSSTKAKLATKQPAPESAFRFGLCLGGRGFAFRVRRSSLSDYPLIDHFGLHSDLSNQEHGLRIGAGRRLGGGWAKTERNFHAHLIAQVRSLVRTDGDRNCRWRFGDR